MELKDWKRHTLRLCPLIRTMCPTIPVSPFTQTNVPAAPSTANTDKSPNCLGVQIGNAGRNGEKIHALYAGAGSPASSALFQAGKAMALKSKLEVVLYNLRNADATEEDKPGIVDLLTYFNYPEGSLPAALSNSFRSSRSELAYKIHDALWEQCRFFKSDATSKSLKPQSEALMPDLLSYIILASRSATLALEKWCDEHQLATNGKANVVVRLSPIGSKPATEEQRQRLEVGPNEELKYRHVQLVCEGRVLSEADNWYVPSRLSDEMNNLLETSDIPFGKVVRGLQPYRKTFDVNMEIQGALFEHQAILYSGDGKPFSEVHERYQTRLVANTPASTQATLPAEEPGRA